MKSFRVISAALLFLSCNGFVGEVEIKPTKQSLVGEWSLATVNNVEPRTINIQGWRINFRNDGTWSYEGEMSGSFAGMKVRGEGRWRTTGDTLEYTAGDQRGSSSFSLASGQLTLTPDPVLAAPGGGPISTAYAKTHQ